MKAWAATSLAVACLVLVAGCSDGTTPRSASPSVASASTEPPRSTPTPTPAAAATVDQLLGRCPSPDELAAVYSTTRMIFTSDPSAGRLVCTVAEGSGDLSLLQERAYQAVLLLAWLRFDAPLPWTDKPLDAWFAAAIHGVDFRGDTDYSFCCEAGGVIVIQTRNLIVLTPTDKPLEIWRAVEGLAALFVHEARHNEGYPHTCANGGDSTIEELGSWGVVYYLQLWVATHTDDAAVPEDYKLWMARDAERIRMIRICSLQSPAPAP